MNGCLVLTYIEVNKEHIGESTNNSNKLCKQENILDLKKTNEINSFILYTCFTPKNNIC